MVAVFGHEGGFLEVIADRHRLIGGLFRPIYLPDKNGSFWKSHSGVFFTTGMMAAQKKGT